MVSAAYAWGVTKDTGTGTVKFSGRRTILHRKTICMFHVKTCNGEALCSRGDADVLLLLVL